MSLHINYCKEFGITKEEIEVTEESQGELLQFRPLIELIHRSMYCLYQVRTSIEYMQCDKADELDMSLILDNLMIGWPFKWLWDPAL